MSERRQEIYCHNCGGYVQFTLDLEMNGKHVLKCPQCKHEHYRYVHDGQISDERWGSANRNFMATYNVPMASVTYSTSSATSGSVVYYNSYGSDYNRYGGDSTAIYTSAT